MFMNFKTMMLCILMLLIAGNVTFGDTYNFTDWSTWDWCDPYSWNPNGLPAAADTARLELAAITGQTITIGEGCDAVCNYLYIGKKSPWESAPVLEVQSGATLNVGNILQIIGPADDPNGGGAIAITGGSVTATGANSAVGKFGGTGTLEIAAGDCTLLQLAVGVQDFSKGEIRVNGGTMSITSLALYNDDNQSATMDITFGKLILRQTAQAYIDSLQAEIDNGYLTAFGGQGTFSIINDPDNNNWITVTAEAPEDYPYLKITPEEIAIGESASPSLPASGTFSAVLNTNPSADVNINIINSNPDKVTIDPASLSFTADNWDSPQSFTVTAIDNSLIDGDMDVIIRFESDADPNSVAPEYAGKLYYADTTVTVIDDESPDILVSQDTVTVAEGQEPAAAYSVSLEFEPSQPVTVTVGAVDILDFGAGFDTAFELNFDSTNYSTPQPVNITVLDDDVLNNGTQQRSRTISHTASGAVEYESATEEVAVNIDDDECGYWGYSAGDYNQDCSVDINDLAFISFNWLNCTSPGETGCFDAR
jgi:hypothetical protein